jgi:hypothetical protein
MKRHFLLLLFLCFYFVAGDVTDGKIMPFEEAETMFTTEPSPNISRMCAKAKCAEEIPAHLDYWYRGYCKDKFPDFAALAIFESQSCPPVQKSGEDSLCVSRYRVIRVLDSASDTLKKEHIEVKEYPLLPVFRYRPILIFGSYNNGAIQIKGYEDVREYFFPLIRPDGVFTNARFEDINKFTAIITGSGSGDFTLYDIYSLHSIGTPYYNADTITGMERMYYNEYLIPEVKLRMRYDGKDFNALWQRLTMNRTKVNATPIKNEFVVLGVIKSMRTVNDSKQKKMCALDIVTETIIKNRTNIDSSITICKYGDCPSLTSMMTPLYFVGDLKKDNMVVEKMISPLDAFVFGDTIYDISMGFPFDEFLRYFLPPDLSVDDYILDYYFGHGFSLVTYLMEEMISQPEQKKRIDAAIIKHGIVYDSLRRNDSLKGIDFSRRQPEQERAIALRRRIFAEQFGWYAITRSFNRYRCRE